MKAPTSLKQILSQEVSTTFLVTEKLFSHVRDSDLSWKPQSGRNWMSIGQLLMHCSSFACGKAINGFVSGDWGPAESAGQEDASAQQHVPPADLLPSVDSVEEALKLLAADKALALHCIESIKEPDLLQKKCIAPWGGPEASLFQHLLLMHAHLVQHKGQLFYYLKLMGRDLDTADLWGS